MDIKRVALDAVDDCNNSSSHGLQRSSTKE
jgi:hypothetical protein